MQTEFRFIDGGMVADAEEWKVIKKFPDYECSTLGRFRSLKTGKYLRGTVAHNGYVHIGLIREKRQHSKLAHRLIVSTFLEQPSPAHCVVNHKNKSRGDNRLSNIEWCTRSDNAKHAKQK